MCASVVTLSGTESRSSSVEVLIAEAAAAEIELAIYKWFIQAERQAERQAS